MKDDKVFDIQVPKEHYSDDYDDLKRFISYFYQIDLIKKLKPGSVLEIGVGNKMVSNYLKHNGFNIETCDFDKELNPDYVGDVRDLPFADGSYDTLLACEVLEHMPWEDFEKILIELHRVSSKYVIISLPHASYSFEFVFRFPFIRTLFKKNFIDFLISLPSRMKDIKFSGEHYWEMGRRSYPTKRIRREFKKYFIIKEEIRPILNSYHHFFILEKNIKDKYKN